MTEQEIESVIDKGGFLVSTSKIGEPYEEIHYKNLRIKKGVLHYGNSRFLSDVYPTAMGADYYVISRYNWREATPEEVEKFIPKQYRK